MPKETGIRPYGPGKFDTILDSYLWEASLEALDDELGDVEGFGWYGMMHGKGLVERVLEIANKEGDWLTREELSELRRLEKGGVILSEDSQGFTTVDWHATKRSLNDAWEHIRHEYDQWYEDIEEDESEAD